MIRHVWCFPFIVLACVGGSNSQSPFIIGGEDAVNEEFPWQASLRSKLGIHFCGGSLISHHYVLTSAYCLSWNWNEDDDGVINPEDVKIHFGAYRLLEKSKEEITAVVEKVIVHPNFVKSQAANDIGLLRTTEKIVFTEAIKPIALATHEEKLRKDEDVIISGWGFAHVWLFHEGTSKKVEVCGKSYLIYKTDATIGILNCGVVKVSKHFGEVGFSHDRLQRATVPVKTGEDCKLMDGEKVWCVGNDRKGACFDDDGGPLVKRVGGTWKLFGISSYLYDDKKRCVPSKGSSRYTDVGFYHKWIQENMSA